MKNTHKCPKCGCCEILRVPGRAGAYGSGNYIPLGLSIFSTAPVHRYICCGCGFIEEWIDPEDIARVKEKFYESTNS